MNYGNKIAIIKYKKLLTIYGNKTIYLKQIITLQSHYTINVEYKSNFKIVTIIW